MDIIFLSLVTTFFLYLQKDIFDWWFFGWGLVVMIIGFIWLHHSSFALHFTNLKSANKGIAHFCDTKHILSHLKACILSIVLFISCSVLLKYIGKNALDYLIIFGFFISIFLYFWSMSDVLSKFFIYEEKHLHLLSLVKLFTAAISISAVVYIHISQVFSFGVTLFILWLVFVYLLYQFQAYISDHRSAFVYKHFLVSLMALGAVVVMYFLGGNIFSVQTIIISLFAYYYMCWGIFKHYLLQDLTWKIFGEYVIFCLLIIGIVLSQNLFWERVL